MNIVEKRYISPELYNFVKHLRYDNYKIDLFGSGGLKSQLYYSDFDLFTSIKKREKDRVIYDKIMKILEHTIFLDNMYFIELKVQNLKGDKMKFNLIEEINYDDFIKYMKGLELIKLDYVIYMDYKFTELSIIYSFQSVKNDNYFKDLEDDIKELISEHNYYKALKRLFSMFKSKYINGDSSLGEKLVRLTKFFNSEVGKLYQDNSNLKAMKLLLEHYDDETTIKKVLINLKDLKLPADINKINSLIRKHDKEINSKAKILYDEIK
jgi:hypothetical protein